MLSHEIREVLSVREFDAIFETQENFDSGTITDHDHYLEIQNTGVFPIYEISSKKNRDITSIDVTHDDGRYLGQLLLIKGKVIEDFYTITSAEFLAYLSDVSRDNFGNLDYTFSTDFFVTSDVPAIEYDREFRKTSDVWGGFSHYANSPSAGSPFVDMVASSKLSVPSAHHSEAFARYTHARNPFERFLRLYHCIELLFDTITVLRIKKLNDDIREFSTILNAHSSKEVDRLISISNEFIYDHESLAKKMLLIHGYEDIAKKIFDDYSKNGNPIAPSSNPPRWSVVVAGFSSGLYTKSDLELNNIIKPQEEYDIFISKISAYWIYRVRCSIAHSRIGEFILTDAELGFVENFAEPLLHEFCSQIFSSQKLKDIL